MWTFLSFREKLILLSGIFEGEGCFGYFKCGKLSSGKTRRKIEVAVEMTDHDIINLFNDFFKKGSVREKKPRKKHHKYCYRWKVVGPEGLKIIHLMIPYLGKRRREKYYGMVQLIRDGGKDRSPYILQPSKDETGDVRCTTNACAEDGSRRGSLSRQAS